MLKSPYCSNPKRVIFSQHASYMKQLWQHYRLQHKYIEFHTRSISCRINESMARACAIVADESGLRGCCSFASKIELRTWMASASWASSEKRCQNISDFKFLRWSSIDLSGLQISMIWANAIICMIWAGIKAAPGCQKSSPSYQFNSLNFDYKKLSVRSVEDHLKKIYVKFARMYSW